jgi:hypothetical protein
MASPMTLTSFRAIVEEALNKTFDEVYDTYTGIAQYQVEVEFDGQDTIQVSNVRNNNGA